MEMDTTLKGDISTTLSTINDGMGMGIDDSDDDKLEDTCITSEPLAPAPTSPTKKRITTQFRRKSHCISLL